MCVSVLFSTNQFCLLNNLELPPQIKAWEQIVQRQGLIDGEMEGYQSVVPPRTVAEAGTQFFLIRLPKEVDVAQLNGKKLHLSNESTSSSSSSNSSSSSSGSSSANSNTITVASKTYHMSLDTNVTSICQTMRPIVTSNIHESQVVGPSIAGILTLEQTFERLETQAAMVDIPMTAYRKLEQVPQLRVMSMPRGSITSMKELQQRKAHGRVVAESAKAAAGTQEPSSSSKTEKKRKHKEDPVGVAATVANTDAAAADTPVITKKKKDKKQKQ